MKGRDLKSKEIVDNMGLDYVGLDLYDQDQRMQNDEVARQHRVRCLISRD